MVVRGPPPSARGCQRPGAKRRSSGARTWGVLGPEGKDSGGDALPPAENNCCVWRIVAHDVRGHFASLFNSIATSDIQEPGASIRKDWRLLLVWIVTSAATVFPSIRASI